MAEKLSKPQADVLRKLGKHGPVSNMMATRSSTRYVTAARLVDLGLARWVRNGYITHPGRFGPGRYERDWEIAITDKGRAVLSGWAGTERFLKMTGAAK